jgi:hypothetical protein
MDFSGISRLSRRSALLYFVVFVSPMLVGQQQTGFLEVCSTAEGRVTAGKLLTITISGITRQFTFPINACTAAIELPVGEVRICAEPSEGVEVIRIEAYTLNVKGEHESRMLTKSLSARTITAQVVAGDISRQTIVMFTNKQP